MGKYSLFLFISILFTFHLTGYAQADCSRILRDANYAFNQKQLRQALNLLQQTETCDVKGSLSEKRIQLQNKIFDAIEAQRTDAEKQRDVATEASNKAAEAEAQAVIDRDKAKEAEKLAKEAEKLANEAKEEADKAKEDAIKANEKNDRIVKASYFYKDQYALAFQNGKYGFINKEGNEMIRYQYDHALPFDEALGWALVRRGTKEYYIDTAGKEYPLVRDLAYLDTTTVEALDLSNRGLTAIPAEVLANTQLKYLNLSGNRISRIPAIKTLKSLLHLDLSNNLLTNLPDDVDQLASLKTLRVRRNRLGAIPSSLGRLAQLELLDLSANKIEELPDSIVNLQKLTLLDLSENKLKAIPGGIGQLRDLNRLYLQNNQLPSLPDEIGALSRLKDLNLSYNNLTQLPPTLSKQLPQLDLLDVSFNTLTQLPPDLNVRLFFNCSGNRLTERPSFVSNPMMLVRGNPFNSK